MAKSQTQMHSILLVDDTTESLQLMTQLLREECYEVRPVLSGEKALHAAKNSPPDLILLDILMPDIDGYEVCRRLMADPETRDIPIIFLTAMNQDENEALGLGLGAVDYISKPFNAAILKARVKTQIQLKVQRDLLFQQSVALKEAYNELESFSYSVTHELKSPIQIIKTYSKCVLKSLGKYKDEQAIKDVTEIQAACVQMNIIINDLLQFSKASVGNLTYETIDLSQMAEEIFSQIKKLNSSRTVEFSCEKNIKVDADVNLMRIALYNLLHNAWKYTEKKEIAKIEFGIEQEQEKHIFFIRDNGIGFEMSQAGDLFTAFKRLQSANEFEGTGVGLASVSRIIKRHGGTIWAESVVGNGSIFRFTLD
jgi:two-component system sensor histidine kinase/response regulator